jgi:hypothetical protein
LPPLYRRPRIVAAMRWFGLALLGLLIAAAVSIAASRLASQQIGLASEPVTAGDALAPATPKTPAVHKSQHQPTGHGQAYGPSAPEPAEPVEPAPEYTEPAPAPVEPQPSGGGGEGADD